jgi:signal transduction histidine kinase
MMWKKMAEWYRGWEDEQLRILDNPELATAAASGKRRKVAARLAELSLIERQQLRDFALKYRGWRFYAAAAKLISLFTLAGVALFYLNPDPGVVKSIILTNALGALGLYAFYGAFFNYRKLVSKGWKALFVVVGWGIVGGVCAVVAGAIVAIVRGDSLAAFGNKAGMSMLVIVVGVSFLFALPMALFGWMRNRKYKTLMAKLENDAERERMARELSESHLRLLRAQIEPHFLFNTLGAVQQLAEKGAPLAAELTANLIAFLRASLDEMRREQVTLQTDFGLIGAYLQVMKVRMGERLRYRLDLPDALAGVNVPAMLLLTLVENAIKHGIEPSLRGGEVNVTAQQEHGLICIRVENSGVGMSASQGGGQGLDNVRTRLKLAYAGAATLLIHDNPDGGVIAEIRLPATKAQGSS